VGRTSREPGAGTVVRNLRFERVIGRGGMGVVYEATHLELDRKVAVKVLSDAVGDDERMQQRFRLEAMATARLSHPNVIEVLEYWHDESGRAYLVMELLQGQPLETWLHEERPLATRLGVARQVLLGLEAAHAGGIVHRDIKPANVFLCDEAQGGLRATLIDFGVAKLTTGLPLALTRLGKTVGTPGYMSPEQIRGAAVDARSDLYAAGCLTYLLLTGLEVFGGGVVDIMRAHLTAAPVPPSQHAPGLAAFDDWMVTALGKRVEERFQTAAAMRDAFDTCCGRAYGLGDASCTLVDAPAFDEDG